MNSHPSPESLRQGPRLRSRAAGGQRGVWKLLDSLCADLGPSTFVADPDSPEEASKEQVAYSGLVLLGEFLGARECSLFRGDPQQGFSLVSSTGERDVPGQLPTLEESTPSPHHPHLIHHAVRRGKPLFVRDVDRFRADHDLPAPPASSSLLGSACVLLPLTKLGENWGIINLAGFDEPPPRPQSTAGRALVHGAQILANSVQVATLLRRLESQASRDGLTELYNYATFYEMLAREVVRAERYKTPLSVVLLDIDYFKGINDRYGHIAGDQILVSLAERIRQALRATDLPARYGGDEFAIILPQTNREGAFQVASRIHEQVLSEPFEYLRTPIPVTVSIGVSELDPGMTAVDLVGRADACLYQAKKRGRDQVVQEV